RYETQHGARAPQRLGPPSRPPRALPPDTARVRRAAGLRSGRFQSAGRRTGGRCRHGQGATDLVIIPDVDLLLYAVITAFAQHPRAHAWWEHAVNSSTRIGLAHPALFGFLRIATNARILATPLPVVDAIAYVREWLAQPNVDLLVPGPRHLDIALGL